MDTILVMAAIGDTAGDVKAAAMAFSVVALIVYLVIKVIRDDNRSAWSSLPLVGIILILATAGGAAYLRDITLAIIKFVLGDA